VFGPSSNAYQLFGGGPFGAPYVLDTVANSPNTNIGAGVWLFDTATGGAEDLVAAPVQGGLHAIVQHQVNFQGDQFDVPFEVTVAGASVTPSAIDITTGTDTGTFDVTFEAGLDLPGLAAEAFGLSQPFSGDFEAAQDNPNDPSSASVKYPFTVEHAASATIFTQLGSDDLDLFLVYDANGDGVFTNGEIVASSATGTSNEFIQATRPADGDYEVWVQGWSVSGNPTFQLTVNVVQGFDLTVLGFPVGSVPAGTPVTLTVDFSKAMTSGESYFGILQLGPPAAPSAISVPITITKS
ncbi:MAG: PPC domain-containing protein, partial [Acidimicrobiia bacterium]|nr:PPC domain-containing protein [Acidimicrobiia bacterium]